MSNWRESIPAEIFDIIFLYLNNDEQIRGKKSLAQCALTCRQWRGPAQRVFFSEITLHDSSDIEKLIKVVLKNEKIGKSAKALYYNRDDGFNAVVLLAINSMLPALEKINFQGSNSLYLSFSEILTEGGKFNNLITLPNPINREQAELYLKCLDYLKDRITIIELFNNSSNAGSLYQELHNNLSRYPKLKKVAIHIPNRDIHFKDVAKYFESIIEKNSMSSLQELSLKSTKGSSYLSIHTSDRETLFPTNALKDIYIVTRNKCHVASSEKFMLFIMSKFPNLDTLIRIEKNKHTMYNHSIRSDSFLATLIQFIIFLSKMSYCSFPYITLPSLNAIKLIEDFYCSEDKKEESQSRPTRSLIIRNNFFTKEYKDATVVTFHNRSTKQQEIKFLLACTKKPDNLNLEQVNLIKKIGRFFDSLSWKIESNANFVTTLSHITKYCTRLRNLDISGSGSQSKKVFVYEKGASRSYSVKTLTLFECVLSQEHLFYIVTQLPNLVKLTLKNCFKHKSVLGQRFYSIDLPISLECLEIEFNKDFNRVGSYYFKLMTDADHKSRYYFFTTKYNYGIRTIRYGGKLEPNSFDNARESVFRDSILDQEISTYVIHCYLVKNFTIKYTTINGYNEKFELLSNSSIA